MVAVGDVFASKVGEQVCLSRVIAAEKPRGPWDKNGRWRVLTCAWVGPRSELPSALERPDSFVPFRLERLKGTPYVQSIGGPPPAEFERVGTHPPSASDRKLRSPKAPGAWQWVEHQVKTELEYRNDPKKFEENWKKAVAARAAARVARRAAPLAKQKARPKTLAPRNDKALAALGATKFSEWRTHPKGFVTAVRKEVRLLSVALRSASTVSAVLEEVSRVTAALNRLEAKHHAIMTPDAEELVEVLVNLSAAAGLDAEFAAQVVDEIRRF